jgi:mono/diheme cytochrome c family protein
VAYLRAFNGRIIAMLGGMRLLRAVVVPAVAALAIVALTPRMARSYDDGGRLYTLHCERCHGITGRGDGRDAEVFLTPPRDLRSGFLTLYPTDVLVRRIREGIPLVLALDLKALRARAGDVEAIAAHLERLPELDWRQIEEGQAVYLDQCELCHGVYGKSSFTLPTGARSPRDLSDPRSQEQMSETHLREVVRHGWRRTPAPDPISARETTSLIAFVRLLSPGYEAYDRFCASCHGEDGRGSGSFAEHGSYPTVVFDRAYFRRRNPEHVRAAIWHMLDTQRPAMPHLHDALTESEAHAIVDHLKGAP